MKLCPNCHIHNRKQATSCHQCGTTLSAPGLPWKTTLLLGLAASGCISKNIGEPEYGVPMIDGDQDGWYEFEDCDDSDPAVGAATEWYADLDGDGYGDPEDAMAACEQPEGYVDNSLDCDDSDAEINPDAVETGDDEVDSNCNDDDNS